MNFQIKYVDVVLPLPLQSTFTYSLRPGDEVEIGQRVVVQFGTRKLYTAVVIDVHENKPSLYKSKDILAILEEKQVTIILLLYRENILISSSFTSFSDLE